MSLPSPPRFRAESPPGRSPSPPKFNSSSLNGLDESKGLVYRAALKKLYDAAWKFDRDAGSSFITSMETHLLEKETFRQLLRAGLNLKLSIDEVDALLPHFNNNGYVDGCNFLLMLYQMRYDHSSQVMRERLEKEAKNRSLMKAEEEKKQQELSSKNVIRVSASFTEEERQSAMAKLLEAAVKYDRLMPGAVQLDAFECEYMTADEFKNQLKNVFGLKLSSAEFAAIYQFAAKSEDGNSIYCAQFLISFFRMGFQERNARLAKLRMEKKRIHDEREQKKLEHQQILEKKNNLKCSLDFFTEDKQRVIEKLNEAARLYDKNAPGAVGLDAFEVKTMEPHVFKEQLKRAFNLKLSPPELGALMSIYDEHKKGVISCSTFIKDFLARGHAERERHLKEAVELQKKAEEIREQKFQEKMAVLANKNVLKLDNKFNEEDMQSAMSKITDAAWRFDKTMPGAASLNAFESRDMEPHVFREQLKRLFSLKLTNEELCALMSVYDPDNSGKIVCVDFVNKFVKLGIDERERRNVEWRNRQRALIAEQNQLMEEKKREADEKLSLKIESFTDADYKSAMAKLTEAAMKYDKNAPGAVGLDAFESDTMPPHVFKEQLKNTFRTKITMGELAALMSYFDKEKKGYIVCKEFLIVFFRIGFEERNKTAAEYRELQKIKNQERLAKEEARRKENMTRGLIEVNYDYTEADFDSALQKIIFISYHFDRRQLGPAGMNGFLCDSLSPTEFREMVKRTFGVKLTGSEVGALVTYFDTNNKGVINCASFINSYKTIKIHCDDFKGKPDEARLVQEYQLQLKDQYRERIRRAATNEGGSAAKKPWQNGSSATSSSQSASTKAVKPKRPYPNTASDKIKLRIMVSKQTFKLDLSTKSAEERDSAASVDENAESASEPVEMEQSKEKEAQKILGSKTFDPRKDIVSILNTKKNGIEFKLNTIPEDVWKLQQLRELWLCNNDISFISPQLGDLRHLRVLSFSNNNLTRLPPELGLLEGLQRLYLDHNSLSALPDLFNHLRNLTELSLSNNQFTAMPPVLMTLCNLIHLDFAENQIVDLPSSLRNMRSLTFLDLSGNPISAPPVVLEKMYWLHVRGAPVPLGEKAVYQFHLNKEEEDEIEDMIKNRGRNVLTNKLRRRKKKV